MTLTIMKSCLLQELLALSTTLSSSMAAQMVFDKKRLKYCSTYNLAEVGVSRSVVESAKGNGQRFFEKSLGMVNKELG